MEDILLLIDSRQEIVNELAHTAAALRSFVAAELRQLLADPDFDNLLPGFLGSDNVSQQRAHVLRQRLAALAQLNL